MSGRAEKYLQVKYYLVDSLKIDKSCWADFIKDLDNVIKTLSLSWKKDKNSKLVKAFFQPFLTFFLFVDFRRKITEKGAHPKAGPNTQQSIQRQKLDLFS